MPVVVLLIISFWLGVVPVQAQTGPLPGSDFGQLSASERWIVQKLAAGEVADLKEQFGEDEQRRQVRAGFLAKLLTERFPKLRIPYQGVRISQAIVTGPLDLENAEVDHWLELLDCRFLGEINLRDCSFKKGLTLSRSLFTRKVEMQRMRVALSVNFSESVFQGPLDLWRAQISGVLLADGLKCEDPEAGANFNSMTVGQAAFFNQAGFLGPVNLVGGKVGDGAQFMGAAFGGPLNFFSTQIGSQLAMVKAHFASGADFGYVSVGSQFIADGARLSAPHGIGQF